MRVHVRDPQVAGRELVAALFRAGVAVEVLERQRPSLEDVFLQLVGEHGRDLEASPVDPAPDARVEVAA